MKLPQLSVPRRSASLPFSSAGGILLLSLIGLGLHHQWLTDLPLTAGDWSWIPLNQQQGWSPWPTTWEVQTGFGFKNFSGAYEFPIYATAGALAQLGLGWNIAEKLLYFWPFAVASFVAPWLFAREVLGSARWAALSALVYAANSYLLMFSAGGQLYIVMAQALAPFALLTFVRSMRRVEVSWALLTGLLFGVQAAYEVRITYLTVLTCLLYVGVLAIAEPVWNLVGRRLGLALATLAVLAGMQSYWLVPLVAYGAHAGLPVAPSPWIAFSQLVHGLTGVHPFWTGGSPTDFKTVLPNPAFFLIPLLAFIPLVLRRLTPETVWLSAVALLTAFLIKQDNPPLGTVYDWMFAHVPGWNVFRETSKLYFLVALAYSVLVPLSLQQLFKLSTKPRWISSAFPMLALAGVLALVCASFVPLETGALGFTTTPRPLPSSFTEVSRVLENDTNYGPVMWLGRAAVSHPGDPVVRLFSIKSGRHPVVELPGTFLPQDSLPFTGDALALFCRDPGLDYCYLNDQLFPYLLRRTGASYVVAPDGASLGALPEGVTYKPLIERLTSILGSPTVFGHGDEALAMWKLHQKTEPIETAQAVAMVEGGTELTEDALPALEALGVPAVFRRGSFGAPVLPNLPATIDVLPRVQGGCQPESTGQFVILAQSNKPTLDVVHGSAHALLPLSIIPRTLPDWGVYGPLNLGLGMQPVSASVPVGPCIEWSPLTAAVLATQPSPAFSGQAEPERVTVTHVSQPWLELRRTWDKAWTLNDSSNHVIGDGLFNLYFLGPGTRGNLTMQFSTAPWERAGLLLSLAWTLLVTCVWLVVRNHRTVRIKPQVGTSRTLLRTTGQYFIGAGVALLALAAILAWLAWWGAPSKLPWVSSWIVPVAGKDPSGRSQELVAQSVLFFSLGITVRLADIAATALGLRRAKQ